MLRHHAGSGRRAAVPPDWATNHAPVAAGSRNATGTLRRATTDGGSTWDPATRTTTPATSPTYAVHCTARIQSLVTHRSDAARIVAEDVVITASYLIAVDHDLDPLEGDEFTVETCSGDLSLEGRILRIEHVVRGTERMERDLYANLLESPPATI